MAVTVSQTFVVFLLLFFDDLGILKSIGQVFRSMTLSWALFDVFPRDESGDTYEFGEEDHGGNVAF